MIREKQQSALVIILKALIPYSRENLLLSFSPNRFFNELEKTSSYKRKNLEETFRRAQKRGLVEVGVKKAKLTKLGQQMVEPYVAKKFKDSGQMMIIFDIPETKSAERGQLRWLLRKWQFRQVQKSVWVTSYNHTKTVQAAVKELGLGGCVRLYECALLYPKNK